MRLLATEYDYSYDLDSPPGRFNIAFLESSGHLAVETQNQQGLRNIDIFITLDGSEQRLCQGIAREWGIREDPNVTLSTVQGIDLQADLLDWRPTSAKSYRGMEILSGSNAPVPSGSFGRTVLHSDSTGNDV